MSGNNDTLVTNEGQLPRPNLAVDWVTNVEGLKQIGSIKSAVLSTFCVEFMVLADFVYNWI